uniref:Uncharacterized protein n=1 Tax=Panagrolaimus sp. JU765 TaxID=591449 RepID=A0AC34Q4Q6_9BILA
MIIFKFVFWFLLLHHPQAVRSNTETNGIQLPPELAAHVTEDGENWKFNVKPDSPLNISLIFPVNGVLQFKIIIPEHQITETTTSILTFMNGNTKNTFEFGKKNITVDVDAKCGTEYLDNLKGSYQAEYAAYFDKNGKNYFTSPRDDKSCPAIQVDSSGVANFALSSTAATFDVIFKKENVFFKKPASTNGPDVAKAGMPVELTYALIAISIILLITTVIGGAFSIRLYCKSKKGPKDDIESGPTEAAGKEKNSDEPGEKDGQKKDKTSKKSSKKPKKGDKTSKKVAKSSKNNEKDAKPEAKPDAQADPAQNSASQYNNKNLTEEYRKLAAKTPEELANQAKPQPV